MIFEVMVVGPLGTNCYIIGCQESRIGVLVDPGAEPERILAEVERLGLKIKYLINTHGHFDHVGGNRKVLAATGAELLIHAEDEPMLGRAAKVATMYGATSENSPAADRHLVNEMRLQFGKQELQVLHTPGHTPGGCCLYLKDAGLVISGDTLFAESVGRSDFPGSSHKALMEGIRSRLMPLPDATKVYPGHGPSTSIGHERLHNPYLVES